MIRKYRPADLPALRRICLLTGDRGTDATGLHADDGLLPDVFLEPYVALEPDTAWVVDVDGTAVGYLVATLDTEAFAERWRAEWTPVFRQRHPRDEAAPSDGWVYSIAEKANFWVHSGYPAHLHIDLLPAAQGRGSGRALMRELALAAIAGSVPGIHLTMSPENAPARAFYGRLGFDELAIEGDALVLGIDPHRLA